MIDRDDKTFINDMVIGLADELARHLALYSEFIERMQSQQNERLDEIIECLNYIGDKVQTLSEKVEGNQCPA